MAPTMNDSIMNVIKQPNLTALNLFRVEERPIESVDEDGTIHFERNKLKSDSIGNAETNVSEVWVAGPLFTEYDRYLGIKYQLTEGGSFKTRYDELLSISEIKIIVKDCYRILRLIRNCIQHNPSGVTVNNGVYSISSLPGTQRTQKKIEIGPNAMRYLYTIVDNIMSDKIAGLSPMYRTEGHFWGLLNSIYDEMCSGITLISDDFGNTTPRDNNPQNHYDGTHLRATVRHPVRPAIDSKDDESITFKHVEVNGRNRQYEYAVDYVYEDHLLPQEIGAISRGISGETIRFAKSDINDQWKIKR